MQQNPSRHRAGRRRFLVGLVATGALSGATACQGHLSSPVSSTASIRQPRVSPTEVPTPPSSSMAVDFGRVVRLDAVQLGGETVRPGDYVRIWLHWIAVGVAQEDLRSLGEIVGPNGRVVGKEDDQIGDRRNQLTRWRVGDRQINEMRIRVPPSARPGEYGLVVAVLRPDNQTRVPISSPTDRVSPWSEDGVLVGTIDVG